ncbi:MAG: MFS transporter, partial [Candidatus Latescibacteria bacterium]|nr:MFS transporter [Candidatus Latescibacterota bacterium]
PLAGISFLFATRSSGYLLGSFLGGRVYDRLPGHPVMGCVLLVMAGAMALVPLSSHIVLCAAVLLVVGITEGTLDVGCNALLVWNHPQNLAPYMNGLHFFFGVGAFVSPILIAQAVVYSGGITWAYWLLALCIVPIALVILKLPSPQIQKDSTEANGKGHSLFVFLIAACFFVFVGAEVGIGGWIYTYAVKQQIADEKTAAYLTSGFWGALTLGRLIVIPLAARFRPRTIMLFDIVGALLSVLVMLVFPVSLIAIWVGTMGTGFFIASMFATLLAFAGRRMVITGRVTGWFFVGSSLGAMTVPWVIGQLFEQVGPQIMLVAVGADLLIAFAIFIILLLQARKMPLLNRVDSVSAPEMVS